MKLTQEHYERIEKYLPKQRGNVKYVAENGCKWRALPKEYGKWHTIYMRMNRWSKKKQAIGRSRGGLTTKIHTLTASERFAINFSLSSGAANDNSIC